MAYLMSLLDFIPVEYDSALYGDSKISTGKFQLFSFSVPLVPLIYNNTRWEMTLELDNKYSTDNKQKERHISNHTF